jgi:hypothetical protein
MSTSDKVENLHDVVNVQVPKSGMHAIYATSWETTSDGIFPLSWAPNDTYVNGIDVTESYLGVHIDVM